MRFLLLLPQRHHLFAAVVSTANQRLPRGTDQRFLLSTVRVSRLDGHGAQRYDQYNDHHHDTAAALPVARLQGFGDEARLPDPGQGLSGRRNGRVREWTLHAMLVSILNFF